MEKPDLTVEWVELSTLTPYENNAKLHDEINISAICESIKENGFRYPILAWHNEDGVAVIVSGHGRACAAERLGMRSVPVMWCDDLDDAHRRELCAVDNQTTMMTGFDQNLMGYELDVLSDVFDMSRFGFEVTIDDGFGTDFELPDDDEPQKKTVTLSMSTDMFSEFEEILSGIDSVRYIDGNVTANKVLEVLSRWAER